MDNPERRSFLRFIIHGLSAIFTIILAFPIVCYILDPRHRKSAASGFRPVEGVRMNELVQDKPAQGFIRAIRRDAWTLYPSDVQGRVWIIKYGPGDNDLHVFTTICPHLGCSINVNNPPTGFTCPCHGACFDLAGQKVGADNVAPRPMDSLEWKRDERDPNLLLVQYQNFRQLESTKIVRT